jgi:hypothetical protein
MQVEQQVVKRAEMQLLFALPQLLRTKPVSVTLMPARLPEGTLQSFAHASEVLTQVEENMPWRGIVPL